MGCDLVAALGAATVSGHTLLGVNHFGLGGDQAGLCVLPARHHAAGENVNHPRIRNIPEVRTTAHVLGWQSPGSWGVQFGCNEHQLTAGVTRWRSRVPATPESLEGADIARLCLERAASARHGVDVVCEFIERHGQGTATGDHVFLVADVREAFVIEAAGAHWALLQCQPSRAVCDVALIRQDWQRLSRDLARYVHENGLWPSDGTKLDVHACLADPRQDLPTALKRWSRATLAMAQQEGAIDAYCLRRMLLEHFDNCQEILPRHNVWHGTQIVSLNPDSVGIVWTAPAHLGTPLFFPLVAGAPAPGVWIDGLPPLNRLWGREDARTQEIQDRLQAMFDQDAEDLIRAAGGGLSRDEVVRRGHEMMVQHAESYIKECQSSRGGGATPRSKPHSDEPLAFVTE